MFVCIFRKQRQTSAPSKITKNPDIEQLKQNIESKKAQRISRQQEIRETLSTLSMASVASSGRSTAFVCIFFSIFLLIHFYIILF